MKVYDTKIEEQKNYQNKNPILIKDIYINKIVVYNKLHFGKQDLKFLIGYKDSGKITYMHIPSTNDYI